jgi:hypothetical protein
MFTAYISFRFQVASLVACFFFFYGCTSDLSQLTPYGLLFVSSQILKVASVLTRGLDLLRLASLQIVALTLSTGCSSRHTRYGLMFQVAALEVPSPSRAWAIATTTNRNTSSQLADSYHGPKPLGIVEE